MDFLNVLNSRTLLTSSLHSSVSPVAHLLNTHLTLHTVHCFVLSEAKTLTEPLS